MNVVAPNSFKDGLSTLDVATTIQSAITHCEPTIDTVIVRMAGGGGGIFGFHTAQEDTPSGVPGQQLLSCCNCGQSMRE